MDIGDPFTLKKDAPENNRILYGFLNRYYENKFYSLASKIIFTHEDARSAHIDYFDIETDTVFEIGLTPNRSDAMGHLGVALDLRAGLAAQGKMVTLKRPSIVAFKVHSNDFPIGIEVKNHKACPRYSGLTISDIKVQESPEWLCRKLQAFGLSPVNNVVDITNYVLHETGNPLHAFDAKKIKGNKIVVKTAEKGTLFKTVY